MTFYNQVPGIELSLGPYNLWLGGNCRVSPQMSAFEQVAFCTTTWEFLPTWLLRWEVGTRGK